MKVYRYPIYLMYEQTVEMPSGKILHVDYQTRAPHGLCLWALVDEDAPIELVRIVITGTGHDVPDGVEHITTVQDVTGFVWHIWRA